MVDIESLRLTATQFDFREKRVGLYKVLVPFFHEDGDMYDIFVEEISGGGLRISDYGLTLQKLSYTFELDTAHKKEVLESIVSQNRAAFDTGMIYLDIQPNQFAIAINQFSQVISKVTNIEIISRELQQSMFFSHFAKYVSESFGNYQVRENYLPTSDKALSVDYALTSPGVARPIFMFGVNENTKASKVVISCLSFKNESIPYRSLIVHEDIDKLSSFYRAQITNVADKQFATLDGFRQHGGLYIKEEMSA